MATEISQPREDLVPRPDPIAEGPPRYLDAEPVSDDPDTWGLMAPSTERDATYGMGGMLLRSCAISDRRYRGRSPNTQYEW